jgi:hypothetical protein
VRVMEQPRRRVDRMLDADDLLGDRQPQICEG